MNDEVHTSGIVAPDGRPARRPTDGRCPRCGAGEERRVNSAGFGPPIICCGECGLDIEGATE